MRPYSLTLRGWPLVILVVMPWLVGVLTILNWIF